MESEIKNMKKEIEMLKKAVEEIKLTMDIQPEFRPEYVRKLRKLEKEGKWISFNSIDELRNSIENA